MARIPRNLARCDLVAVLKDILDGVQSGDTMEGHISWALPEDASAGADTYDVIACYRVGNLQGQGGMRMLDGGEELVRGSQPEQEMGSS